ncbi:MAG: hypothetical protein M1814_004649 [Vezdaea aestivalis]|nr:MAG: hypothetical protein M1814_004649 [Vezdaea aestivalis]
MATSSQHHRISGKSVEAMEGVKANEGVEAKEAIKTKEAIKAKDAVKSKEDIEAKEGIEAKEDIKVKKGVKAKERYAGNSSSDHTPRPPPRPRAEVLETQLLGHLRLILHHILVLFGTILGYSRLFIAIPGTIILVAYISHYASEIAIQKACSIRGASHFSVCKPVRPRVLPVFEQVLKQETTVAQIQNLASDTVALPYRLLTERMIIKDLIFQISAADLPSQQILMPKVTQFNTLLDKAVDSIQNAQIRTDSLVDNTIAIYAWAEDQLKKIDSQGVSHLAPLRNLAGKLGIPIPKVFSEQAVQQMFFGYADRLQSEADAVIVRYNKASKSIAEFRDLLDNLVLVFAHEGDIVDRENLAETSYWKWLLRSHRHTMKGFENKMKLCAQFYKYLLESRYVVQITLFKMEEMRGRISALEDEFKRAPQPLLRGGAKPSLRLTINAIKMAAAYLENSRTISKEQQKQRMIEFEKSWQSSKGQQAS